MELYNEHDTDIPAKGWAVYDASANFQLFDFQRRALKANDILIRIHFCGVCHSDIHEVHSDWSPSMYPLVPGHEITGVVEKIGSNVVRFQIGDRVGVGCMVDSCRHCIPCMYQEQNHDVNVSCSYMHAEFFTGQTNMEQHCVNGPIYTYNCKEMNIGSSTFGGEMTRDTDNE
jgi:alcohol dehydrogenase (NADP+)